MARQAGKRFQAYAIVGSVAPGQRQISAVSKCIFEVRELVCVSLVSQKNREQTVGCIRHIRPHQTAASLARAPLSCRKQARKAGVSSPVCGIDQKGWAVCEIEPAADDEPHAAILGTLMGPHDAAQRVAIGNSQRGKSQNRRSGKKLLDM